MHAALLVDRRADPRAVAGQNRPQVGEPRISAVMLDQLGGGMHFFFGDQSKSARLTYLVCAIQSDERNATRRRAPVFAASRRRDPRIRRTGPEDRQTVA